jgi:hypothetical protein
MPREEYLVEERKVGNCTVKVYFDTDPQHPDEGTDDLFLVSFSNDFHIVRKGTWDCAGDFRDFLNPRFQVDGWNPEEELPEPTTAPVANQSDSEWRRVYVENCSDQLEQLLLTSGEESDFTNPEGRTAATEDFYRRQEIWNAWQRFNKARSEWACFMLDVRYHGGGRIGLSLGEIYDGSETDRWGDPAEPRGFVMVKRTAGWNVPPEEVAKSLVSEWQSYCDGEVYGYVVTDDLEEEKDVDSCWGFIGDLDHCMAEGVSAAEWHETKGRKQVPLPFTQPQDGANG